MSGPKIKNLIILILALAVAFLLVLLSLILQSKVSYMIFGCAAASAISHAFAAISRSIVLGVPFTPQ